MTCENTGGGGARVQKVHDGGPFNSLDDRTFGIYSVSLELADTVLASINDRASYSDSMETVQFSSDLDACSYRLRFETDRLAAREWTFLPNDERKKWIAEHTPDAECREWTFILFPRMANRIDFQNAVIRCAPDVEFWTWQDGLPPRKLCAALC